jgi:hypothetical protein
MRAKQETQRAQLIALLGALHAILQKKDRSRFEQEMLGTAEVFSPLLSMAEPSDYEKNLDEEDVSYLLQKHGKYLSYFYAHCEQYIYPDDDYESDWDDDSNDSAWGDISDIEEEGESVDSQDFDKQQNQKAQLIALLDTLHAISKKKNPSDFEKDMIETAQEIDSLLLLIAESDDYEKDRDGADLSFFIGKHRDEISEFYEICKDYIDSGESHEVEDDDADSVLGDVSDLTVASLTTSEGNSINSENIDKQILRFSEQLSQYQDMNLPKQYVKARDEYIQSISKNYPTFYRLVDDINEERPHLSDISNTNKVQLVNEIDYFQLELRQNLYGLASRINFRAKHNQGRLEEQDRALIANFETCGIDPKFVQEMIPLKKERRDDKLPAIKGALSPDVKKSSERSTRDVDTPSPITDAGGSLSSSASTKSSLFTKLPPMNKKSPSADDTKVKAQKFKSTYQKNKEDASSPDSSSSEYKPSNTGRKFN